MNEVDEPGGACISGWLRSAGPSDWVALCKVRAKVAPWPVSGIPQWPSQTGTGQMRRDTLPSPPTGGTLMCSCWAPGSDNKIKWREWKESFGTGEDFKIEVVWNKSRVLRLNTRWSDEPVHTGACTSACLCLCCQVYILDTHTQDFIPTHLFTDPNWLHFASACWFYTSYI